MELYEKETREAVNRGIRQSVGTGSKVMGRRGQERNEGQKSGEERREGKRREEKRRNRKEKMNQKSFGCKYFVSVVVIQITMMIQDFQKLYPC